MASARFAATLAVMPLAEKYATSFQLISNTPLEMQILSSLFIIPLFDFSCCILTVKRVYKAILSAMKDNLTTINKNDPSRMEVAPHMKK